MEALIVSRKLRCIVLRLPVISSSSKFTYWRVADRVWRSSCVKTAIHSVSASMKRIFASASWFCNRATRSSRVVRKSCSGCLASVENTFS